jgi:4-alpha-glucanotransferase
MMIGLHFSSQQLGIDEVNFWQPRELIRNVVMSVANMSIFPMEDILGLREEARMNRPYSPAATDSGNFLQSNSQRF